MKLLHCGYYIGEVRQDQGYFAGVMQPLLQLLFRIGRGGGRGPVDHRPIVGGNRLTGSTVPDAFVIDFYGHVTARRELSCGCDAPI